MRYLDSYDERVESELNKLTPQLGDMLIEGDESKLDSFIDINFPVIFEDILINSYLEEYLINESILSKGKDLLNRGANWISDKIEKLKANLKNFLSKIGKSINDSLLNKFTQKLKQNATQVSEDIIELFDSMKESVIKMNLITPDNNINVKGITNLVMEVYKSEKKKSEDIEAIEKLESDIKLTESYVENIFNRDSINFINQIVEPNYKSRRFASNNFIKIFESDESEHTDGEKITQFNVEGVTDGKNITKETIGNSGISIFTKFLVKLGVKSPRAEVAIRKLALILVPIIITLIIGLFAGTNGAALVGVTASFSTVGFSLFTVVCGLFFIIGVFLMMCWFRKPYPDLSDYIEYLEAWFTVYPDGRRINKNIENIKYGKKKREGWGYFDENRLNKDTTKTLFAKWKKLNSKKDKTKEEKEYLDIIVDKIKKRYKNSKKLGNKDLDVNDFEAERSKLLKSDKEKKSKVVDKGKMVSYKDSDSEKYRVGVAGGQKDDSN